VKPGIVVIAEIGGDVGARVHAVQQRYDPRMAAELPPHLTFVGSSGLGPISVRTSPESLRDALLPVTEATAPLTLRFEAPIRFMQSQVVVLPIDPNGPVRALHEGIATRVRSAGIGTERARFTFTPHCTLNLYRELPARELRELLAMRFDETFVVDAIQVYRAVSAAGTERLFELPLGGTEVLT
jgi:2'-5' RNA ligase